MLVAHLVRVEDMPLPGVLAAVHAEVMNAIVSVYGGDMAAGSARLAADRLAGLPSSEEWEAENPLTAMAAQGRA